MLSMHDWAAHQSDRGTVFLHLDHNTRNCTTSLTTDYWKCIISLKEKEREGKNTLPTQHSNKSRKKRGIVITDFDWVCMYEIGSAPLHPWSGFGHSFASSQHCTCLVKQWQWGENKCCAQYKYINVGVWGHCHTELEHTNHMWCI